MMVSASSQLILCRLFMRPLGLLFLISLYAIVMWSCVPLQPSVGPPTEQYTHRRAAHLGDFVAVIVQRGDTFSSLAKTHLGDPSKDWLISEFNGGPTLSPGQELIIPLKDFNKGGLSLTGYQTVPVLCYHKFSKTESDPMTVTEKDFEDQMKFLREKGYRVITTAEFFDFVEFKRQLPGKSVLITIDDGWRSTYEIAFPILRKYHYPSTLFLYTDLISGTRSTLDWDLVKEMAGNGVDIQCHTVSHRSLIKAAGQGSFKEYFDFLCRELGDSAQIIKKKLNIEVKYLAYPYGDTSPLVVAVLQKLGYRGAFTVERGSSPFFVQPYRINRSMIYGDFDLDDFERNLTIFRGKGSN